jgi:hypothetical protein
MFPYFIIELFESSNAIGVMTTTPPAGAKSPWKEPEKLPPVTSGTSMDSEDAESASEIF